MLCNLALGGEQKAEKVMRKRGGRGGRGRRKKKRGIPRFHLRRTPFGRVVGSSSTGPRTTAIHFCPLSPPIIPTLPPSLPHSLSSPPSPIFLLSFSIIYYVQRKETNSSHLLVCLMCIIHIYEDIRSTNSKGSS